MVAEKSPFFDQNPCEVAALPRQQAEAFGLTRPAVLCFLIGASASVIFVQEAGCILTALRQGAVSWFFLFLLLALLSAMVTAALLALAMVYLLLIQEIYHWQWLSFLAPFSAAVFVFVYAIQYVLTRTHLTRPSELALYFLYGAIVAVVYGLICGAAGFLAANAFVRVMFGSLGLA
jgi:transmembrane 9 superfamily protein 3